MPQRLMTDDAQNQVSSDFSGLDRALETAKHEAMTALMRWLNTSAPDSFSMRDFRELTSVVFELVEKEVRRASREN